MLNQVRLRGFVADDPFIRATEEGKVARLRIATTERVTRRKDGRTLEHTEWHTVVLWGKCADLADKEIRVGMAVDLEGALRTRDWEDNKGRQHRTTDIVAHTITLIEGGIEGYSLPKAIEERKEELYPRRAVAAKPISPITPPEEDPDELPF
ncbi:MAG: single-stranded DNA-binding protein [Rikenellaceae bacterium]